MRCVLLFLVMLCAWSTTTHAQRRWIVQVYEPWRLQEYITAAQPGDVILIQAPRIGGVFVNGKGLTIRGDGVRPISPAGGVYAIPAGQVQEIEGIDFSGGLSVSDCVGSVVLRNCHIEDISNWHACSIHNASLVDLMQCDLRANTEPSCGNRPTSGLYASSSRVALTRCVVVGSSPVQVTCWIAPFRSFQTWIAEGPAVQLVESSLIFLNSTAWRAHPSAPVMEITDSRILASPPPNRWILANPGTRSSEAHFYGPGASAGGAVIQSHDTRQLPTTLATLSGRTLRIEVRSSAANSVGFLGIGLRPEHVLLSPFGHHGAILVPTDRSQSALFDTFITDAAGGWALEYTVPEHFPPLLLDHYFVFQALMLDPQQTIWAGSPDVVRF